MAYHPHRFWILDPSWLDALDDSGPGQPVVEEYVEFKDFNSRILLSISAFSGEGIQLATVVIG